MTEEEQIIIRKLNEKEYLGTIEINGKEVYRNGAYQPSYQMAFVKCIEMLDSSREFAKRYPNKALF